MAMAGLAESVAKSVAAMEEPTIRRRSTKVVDDSEPQAKDEPSVDDIDGVRGHNVVTCSRVFT